MRGLGEAAARTGPSSLYQLTHQRPVYPSPYCCPLLCGFNVPIKGWKFAAVIIPNEAERTVQWRQAACRRRRRSTKLVVVVIVATSTSPWRAPCERWVDGHDACYELWAPLCYDVFRPSSCQDTHWSFLLHPQYVSSITGAHLAGTGNKYRWICVAKNANIPELLELKWLRLQQRAPKKSRKISRSSRDVCFVPKLFTASVSRKAGSAHGSISFTDDKARHCCCGFYACASLHRSSL